MHFYYLFLAVLILLPTSISAAEIKELKEIKVTSSRETLTVEDIPASLSVFTEKEIKRKQHRTVKDLLQGELGLHAPQLGPPGSQTSIFMRGAASESTLIVIDGVPSNLGTTGAYDFGDLDLDNVERVEVLRGPQSIQWGNNAVGGVINIITKKGEGAPTHTVSFEGGSYQTFRESIRSSGSINKFDYSASASLLMSDGFSTLNERSGGFEEDATERKTFSTRLGYDFNPDTRLEFIGRYIKTNDETDSVNGEESGTDYSGYFNNGDDILLSMPFYKNFGKKWKLKITPSFLYNRTNTITERENDGILNRVHTLDMQNIIQLNREVSVLFGAEYQNTQGYNLGGSWNADGYQKWHDNEALFLQGIYELPGHLLLTAGFRQDWNTAYDESTTEKFEASYQLPKTSIRLHAAYATGFRAPSLNDLYAPPGSGFTRTSNPALLPEEVKGSELGIKNTLKGGKLKVGSTFFYTETKNFIHGGGPNSVKANFGEYHSMGLESSMDLKFSRNYSLSIHHTWNDTYLFEKTKAAHYQPPSRRPKHKVNANLSYNSKNGFESIVGLFIRSSARGWNKINDTRAYGTVRAAMSYRLPVKKNIKWTLRGENLLDARAMQVGGFGSPGRSFYTGFTYTFN